MREFGFTQTQRVERPLEEVFGFFSDPRNLTTITPEWLQFKILTPAPVEMAEGTLIDYSLRLHGIPVTWQSKITYWEPPFCFIDEQVRGPYQKWVHTHTFTRDVGGTRVSDDVRYAVFGGALIRRFIDADIRKIFSFRQRKLAEIFA
jgi:ligand-binding SRPBCC domain-containing protein